MKSLKQEAIASIKEAEQKALMIKGVSPNLTDTSNNVRQGLAFTLRCVEMIDYEPELREILVELRVVHNKLRLAMFDPTVDNVHINKLINGTFVTYEQ